MKIRSVASSLGLFSVLLALAVIVLGMSPRSLLGLPPLVMVSSFPPTPFNNQKPTIPNNTEEERSEEDYEKECDLFHYSSDAPAVITAGSSCKIVPHAERIRCSYVCDITPPPPKV